MQQQLANEETARVFAMYPTTELYYYNEGYSYAPKKGKVLAVNFDSGDITINKYEHIEPNYYRYLQLLLTPLSAITDEHAIEVAKYKVAGLDTDDIDITNLTAPNIQPSGFLLSVKYYENRIRIGAFNLCTWSYQYLIQQHYAVPLFFGINHPCNGKTAIELGIAIDKTIHLQNQS